MIRIYRKIGELLTAKHKRKFAVLVALMIVTGVTEMTGVAAVMPFLAVLANQDAVAESELLSSIYNLLGFETTYGFLLFLGLCVFAVTVISIGLRVAQSFAVNRFARTAAVDLSVSLLRRYMARPYEWFLSQHSADLGKAVLEEVRQVVTGAIAPAARIIANVIKLSFLVGLLLYLEPLGAIAVGLIVGGAFSVAFMRLRNYLTQIGRDRRQAVLERYKITAEALGGIKECKLLGLEDIYVRRFTGPSERVARHQALVQLLGELPRHVMEGLAFGGILLFVLYLLWTHPGGVQTVLPVLGAFAFAGLKMMPTVQQLFGDLAALRFGEAAVDSLMHDLDQSVQPPRRAHESPLRLTKQLALDDVHYSYPTSGRTALNGLTLTIPAGASVGIVGPTGAGKTTVVDVILGLLEPQQGTMTVDGTVINRANLRRWQSGIGYVPQSVFLTADSVSQNIAFGADPGDIDDEAVRRAATLANISTFIEQLPAGYDTEIGENGVRLSGGQRQRLGIARALYHDPEIVVFDEATSALDTIAEKAILDAVQTLHGRKTIIMITHRLTTVSKCDIIFVLNDGRVEGWGDYRSLAEDNDAFRSLLQAAE